MCECSGGGGVHRGGERRTRPRPRPRPRPHSSSRSPASSSSTPLASAEPTTSTSNFAAATMGRRSSAYRDCNAHPPPPPPAAALPASHKSSSGSVSSKDRKSASRSSNTDTSGGMSKHMQRQVDRMTITAKSNANSTRSAGRRRPRPSMISLDHSDLIHLSGALHTTPNNNVGKTRRLASSLLAALSFVVLCTTLASYGDISASYYHSPNNAAYTADQEREMEREMDAPHYPADPSADRRTTLRSANAFVRRLRAGARKGINRAKHNLEKTKRGLGRNYQLSQYHRTLQQAMESTEVIPSTAVAAPSISEKSEGSEAPPLAAAAATEPTSSYQPTPPYTSADVLRTQLSFDRKAALLVFDGTRSTIDIYASEPDLEGPTRYWPSYVLARALYQHFPDRFREGQPPFQLLMTSMDYPHLKCLGGNAANTNMNDEGEDGEDGGDMLAGCAEQNLSPILAFGSVPRDSSLLPSVTAMPLPPFAECLVRDCRLLSAATSTKLDGVAWEQLKPQILWRGTDYQTFSENFDLGLQHGADLGLDLTTMSVEDLSDRLLELWDTLTPRWRAVASSIRAKIDAELETRKNLNDAEGNAVPVLPWIDARFTIGRNPAYKLYDAKFLPFLDVGADVATTEYMGSDEMASYRYHLDVVGGSGTTWEGTVRKLAMPGLLFHHETLMKDWFYDELKPWVHYVPVRIDLSDLSEKYVWAEQHPVEAQTIAQNGRDFVKTMAMEGWKKETYQKLFVNKLGEIVNAYQPGEGESLETILGIQESNGLKYRLYSTCTDEACAITGKGTRTFSEVGYDYLKNYDWMGAGVE